MSLPDIPSQYTLPVARADWPVLLGDWRALLPEGFAPWLLTKFGELFISQPDAKIGMLQVSSFQYAVVAKDQTDFREWLVDPGVRCFVRLGACLPALKLSPGVHEKAEQERSRQGRDYTPVAYRTLLPRPA